MGRPIRWIVGFFDIDRPRMIFSPFLKPGFRHAIAFGYDVDKKLWVSLDWGKRGLGITLMNDDECDRLVAFVERHNGCFLQYDGTRAIYRMPLMPCWCVTAIRHLLGIRTPLLTPWQLYCALVKRGAQPIFERSRENEGSNG